MPTTKRVAAVMLAVATMLLAGCLGPASGKCITDERKKVNRVGDTIWVSTDTTYVCRK